MKQDSVVEALGTLRLKLHASCLHKKYARQNCRGIINTDKTSKEGVVRRDFRFSESRLMHFSGVWICQIIR